jgi:hypothetical protein
MAAGNLFLLSTEKRQANFCHRLMSCFYKLFAADAPLKWISQIFLLKPLKLVLRFKEQVAFKCKKNISSSMRNEDSLNTSQQTFKKVVVSMRL